MENCNLKQCTTVRNNSTKITLPFTVSLILTFDISYNFTYFVSFFFSECDDNENQSFQGQTKRAEKYVKNQTILPRILYVNLHC